MKEMISVLRGYAQVMLEYGVTQYKVVATSVLREAQNRAYVVDQVRDKMIGNEAALGVIYSGEALYTQRENQIWNM